MWKGFVSDMGGSAGADIPGMITMRVMHVGNLCIEAHAWP